MGDQRIDQRAGLMARGGMHHETPGLVDDDDIVVLIDDIERDILAFGLGGDRLRHVDCDRIARCDVISGVANGKAFDGDLPRQDQRFQPRSRQFRKAQCEHAVEPGRALVAGNGDGKGLRAKSLAAECLTAGVNPVPKKSLRFNQEFAKSLR